MNSVEAYERSTICFAPLCPVLAASCLRYAGLYHIGLLGRPRPQHRPHVLVHETGHVVPIRDDVRSKTNLHKAGSFSGIEVLSKAWGDIYQDKSNVFPTVSVSFGFNRRTCHSTCLPPAIPKLRIKWHQFCQLLQILLAALSPWYNRTG